MKLLSTQVNRLAILQAKLMDQGCRKETAMADNVRIVGDSDREFTYVKLTACNDIPSEFYSDDADCQKVDLGREIET